MKKVSQQFWLREDGLTAVEMVVLFVIFCILIFTVVPYYTSLANHAHEAKVTATYSIINSSIIGASVDSVFITGSRSVPNPSQLSMKNTATWFDSKFWSSDESGTWTYLPTGAMIVYTKINDIDYTLDIIL